MAEQEKPVEGGEVYVFADQTVVQTEHLRILFDALCSSMDFGSGFLDTEEVEALRRLADALGVNPMEATPSEFKLQYAHDFEARDAPKGPGSRWLPDRRCLRPESPEDFAARVAATVAKCRHCGREFDRAKHTPREVSA